MDEPNCPKCQLPREHGASVPLALAVLGSIGDAIHRISVAREHVTSFDRRHAPLPVAIVRES